MLTGHPMIWAAMACSLFLLARAQTDSQAMALLDDAAAVAGLIAIAGELAADGWIHWPPAAVG